MFSIKKVGKFHHRIKAGYVVGFLFLMHLQLFGQQVGNYVSHTLSGRTVLIEVSTGESFRITAYGDYMVRVQAVRGNEDFYADDHYEMVANHDWPGKLSVDTTVASVLSIATEAADGVLVSVTKTPLRLSFKMKNGAEVLLQEKDGVVWSGNTVTESFAANTDEHFAGLGHERYGRLEKLDRKGTSLKVRSGSEGACVVPYYLSSKGYGIFLNTTFTNTITLCKSNVYSLMIDDEGFDGRMDYFFIGGPALTKVVDRYTQLTGRPRMLQKSIFGLHLSDKADPNNNGEQWWKNRITEHRNAGYAFDHQVNDNAWRASDAAVSGQMTSWFDWRKDKYANPAEYKKWCDDNGVTVTLDINRPGLSITPGWNDATYGMPGTKACPDFTNSATRKWLWQLFFSKSLDPALKYPDDAIWLDEFDYPDQAHSMTLSSGKRWAEESINYHFSLQKALVQEGWDVDIGEAKRPYFWSRGITAGAQRFGTYWSGDLKCNFSEMVYQVRAFQSAGISGFPYFNHDAGGHGTVTGNEDNLFQQWSMGFGSFTPIWKPHGWGWQRWPTQRNTACKNTAKTYITCRYQMMPYIYSYAYIAHATGIPMARPMFLDDQDNATAWQKELQYLWGKEMLVAPNCSDGGKSVSVWLPKGNWYDFWNDEKYIGGQTIDYSVNAAVVPVFVKEGAIIPMAPYAKSTFFIPKDTLVIHVFTGADGIFQLYEDDGVTEKFNTKEEFRMTNLKFSQESFQLAVGASEGMFANAPANRSYQIVYHGLTTAPALYYDTAAIKSYTKVSDILATGNGSVWDATAKVLTVKLAALPVDKKFTIGTVPTHVGNRAELKHVAHMLQVFPDKIVANFSNEEKPTLVIHQLNGALVHNFSAPTTTIGSRRVFSLQSLGMSKGMYILIMKLHDTELVRHIVIQ